jgi:membrane protein DedA with SNARE-associated domain
MNLSVDILGPLIDWLVGLMQVIGAPGAGIAVALENIFPPIPSEVILPLAGFTASQGHFSVLSAILWTTAGSAVGALALYWVGRRLGTDRLKRLFDRIPLLKSSDIDRTNAWFSRHGRKAVFFGRMVPLFRSLISVPAGVERMPVWRFLLYTTAGSLVWNTVLILAGWELGANWHIVERHIGIVQNVLVAILVAVVAWFLVHRIRQVIG